MTDRFAFKMIRELVMNVKNGLLYNMNQEINASLPVVVSVAGVEEDGHIWLYVNSKSKKWIEEINIPVRVQFISEKSVVDLNGIARFAQLEELPEYLTDEHSSGKSILFMKTYYGEYVPFAEQPNPFQFFQNIMKWFRHQSGKIPILSNRRMFIFR